MTSNELKKNHKEVINPKNVKDRVKEIQTYVKLHPKKIEDIEIKKILMQYIRVILLLFKRNI
ncbi:hypothetical protein HMPREF9466_01542 [Fusobacterium necrophorum subsp. funduliforme 1_1_36S]|nr:hypothetical protein HMPREF9466_01542 [Fusobacterium necrophorum subsp. funduliforme 1_1_36S]